VGGATVGLSYALGVYYNRQAAAKGAAAGPSAWPTFSILPTEELNGAIVGAAKLF
jgi:hypothetical protein